MTLYHPTRDVLDLPTVLHALSDPHRLRIVRVLAESNEPCQCGAFGLEVTKSTLTHHFRVLREAGVISQRCVGTSKLNTLRGDDLDARFPGLLTAVLAAMPTVTPVLADEDRGRPAPESQPAPLAPAAQAGARVPVAEAAPLAPAAQAPLHAGATA